MIEGFTKADGFLFENGIRVPFFYQDIKTAANLEKTYENLKIVVKDVIDFNKELIELMGHNHKELLRNYVLEENPNMLIIAWCHSSNGDVCTALRVNGEMSRMIVEAEMRDIGIASNNSKLHPEQIEVLKSAQDPNVKILTLAGGTGSGKTILAAETVKIWAAQHLEELPTVSYDSIGVI